MNRRKMLACLGAIGIASFGGCNASFWGNWGKKPKVAGFSAVNTGMSEKQVVKLLGAPNRRAGFRLEGGGPPAIQMTWVHHNELLTVTFVSGAVYHKEKTS
ncbi:MAG: hypothetical protein K8U03_00475 [Planctomycetia bacterium]|nr:hypothetical protein [Planctomycetia bacterium]